jgi:hypothetical protein
MSKRSFNPVLESLNLSPIVLTSEVAKGQARLYEARTGKECVHFHRGERRVITTEARRARRVGEDWVEISVFGVAWW